MPKCKFCDTDITWIVSVNNKNVPVDSTPLIRNGSEVFADGRYFDKEGNFWQPADVPCKVPVWRSHWSDCPGAKEARRK